jgi:amidase
LRFKLIQSRVLDKMQFGKRCCSNKWFSEDYQKLKPLVLEQDIPTIQSHIQDGSLTYETLTQWYLYRIVKREQQNEYLNNIIAINPGG